MQITSNNIGGGSNVIKLSEATKIAIGFLQEINQTTSISMTSAETVLKNDTPYLHVINTNKGFVILSADSAYKPILAYNKSGMFSLDSKNLNAGIAVWINAHGRSIAFLRNNKSSYVDSITTMNKSLWAELGFKYKLSNKKAINSLSENSNSRAGLETMMLPPPPPTVTSTSSTYPQVPVGPLCGTNWDQISPYNEDCPNYSSGGSDYNGHWLAGSGPTAMGQIMYYWQTPSNGKYNWSVMNTLAGQGLNYIPLLLADIGSTKLSGVGNVLSFYGVINWSGGTFAQYGAGPFSIIHNGNETFTDDYYAPYVFGNFGFTSASRTESLTAQMTNPVNGVSYGSFLVSEIVDYRRPCMITASTGQNNLGLGLLLWPYADFHTLVCEGEQEFTTATVYTTTTYKSASLGGGVLAVTTSTIYNNTDYLYMNWGWGEHYSSDNGFYYISNVNYTQPYINATTPDFKNNTFLDFQTIVYNIHP